MRQRPFHGSSAWWRATRYEIHDGCIRPAVGARVKAWDPWRFFHEIQGRYRTVETLWGKLAELNRQLAHDAVAPLQPSPAGEDEILEWCHQFGLFGLLPGAALIINPPPERVSDEPLVNPNGRLCFRSKRRRYGRVGGYWFSETRPSLEKPTPAPARSAVWDWIKLEFDQVPTHQALQGYYPEDRPFPPPFSREFWSQYQEPVKDWLRATSCFSESITAISAYADQLWNATPAAASARSAAPTSARELGSADEKVNAAIWRLNSLATGEAKYFRFGPRTLVEDVSSASLLSALARMFFLDVQAGRRLMQCAVCQRMFVSNEHRSRYCQESCRNLAQTRRYRAHIKAEKDLMRSRHKETLKKS